MLLVYLDDDLDSWQRRDASGRPDPGIPQEAQRRSIEPPRRSARAEPVIAIVPASRMRTLAVVLPPAPPEKLPRLVRFALEEQLAGDVEAQHVVVAGTRGAKTVVHALERAWLAERAARLEQHGARPLKIVAESDLVPPADARAM